MERQERIRRALQDALKPDTDRDPLEALADLENELAGHFLFRRLQHQFREEALQLPHRELAHLVNAQVA